MPVSQHDIDNVVATCAAAGFDAATCGRNVISRVCGISEKRARTIQAKLRGGNGVQTSSLEFVGSRQLQKSGFIEEFRDVLAEDRFFQFSVPRQPVVMRADTAPEIFCAAVSDLHLTEVVRLQDSNGINFYTSIVAANRLWDHSQQLKARVLEQAGINKILKLWCPILGDMVSGSIHPEYLVTNDLTDPAAVVLCTRLLTMFFKEIGSLGLPIEISAVHGNHPRLTPKMPTKRQAHTNLDWEVYEFLADALRSDEQFSMEISTAQIGRKKLFNWTYLFEHGIGVKNTDLLESRLRDLFDDNVYREAVEPMGSSFDMWVIGDRHRPELKERGIVNGSYIGQNELGQSWRLKPIRAQQLMWGVSEKEVRTWSRAADVTNIKHERPENPFSDYASWFMRTHGR